MSVLEAVLNDRAVVTHFQAIVSIKKHALVGLEALSRGRSQGAGLIDPQPLFHEAIDQGRSDELCAICREQALQEFASLQQRPAGLMLFLNLEADQLTAGRFSASAFLRQAQSVGLRAQDIALELSAPLASRTPGLRAVIETLQGFGFTVALEDVSASGSDQDLLPLLKPDIIKADQGLLHSLTQSPVRQEQLRGLFSLGHRLGALCVAEAVETEEQSALCLELGADLLQGHLYSRATAPAQLNLPIIQSAVDRSASRHKAMLAGRSQTRKRETIRHMEILGRLLKALEGEAPDRLESVLSSFVNAIASLECLYVMDAHGRQITPTVIWQHQASGPKSSLFAPAMQGADHGLKDYFLGLQLSDRDRFVSDPYVSLASGNVCRTLAARFSDANGDEAVLCVDIRSL